MKMIRIISSYKAILLCLIMILFGSASEAQMATVKASLDTNAIMLGDQIGLNLKAKAPKGFKVEWPVLHDTLAPHIEVINRGQIDSTLENGFVNFQRHITITSFDSGYFQVPSLNFKFRNKASGKVYNLKTQGLFLRVYVPQVDTSKAFKVIKGLEKVPYTLGEILPWILLGLAIIGVIIFLIWFIQKRKKNQPLFVRKPKPKLPPHEMAIKKLEELRLARIWQTGKLKVYYTSITDIMKEYFSDRFEFEALEMTTEEIMNRLKEEKINNQAMAKLKDTLELSDLVKFAKAEPSPLENDTNLNYCVDFVNETKAAPLLEEEADAEKQLNAEKEEQ